MVTKGPETGVEDGDLESALAVEGRAHSQVHNLLAHLQRREIKSDDSHVIVT